MPCVGGFPHLSRLSWAFTGGLRDEAVVRKRRRPSGLS